MKCPYCARVESKVLDSRMTEDGGCIRRRRECISCARRFTTYERFDEISLMVVKKDKRRERFEKRKILDGIVVACRKRPVGIDDMESLVDAIEREIKNRGESEIPTVEIGKMVMERLQHMDGVAYVRFASVYKDFKDTAGFADELRLLEQIKVKLSSMHAKNPSTRL